MNEAAFHAFVSGAVQGVGFRAHTAALAQGLGLHGWTRNLADGRVEVWAAGPRAKAEALMDWLHKGPPSAKVLSVCYEKVAFEPGRGFQVRPNA